MKPTACFALLTLAGITMFSLTNTPQANAAVLSEWKGQSGVTLENVEASYQFGEQITFVATIKTGNPLSNISIVISDESQGITRTESVNVQADGRTEFRLDTKQAILRPFATVKWHYQFTLSDGNGLESPNYSMRYADNRFTWQTLEAATLRVNWYQGDASFGQAALNAAQSGFESIRNLMPLDLAQPIEVFIYANASDFRSTLLPGSEDWITGHTDPALGIVMIVIEPGVEQGITMEQRIPHELMHVMSYRRFGVGYGQMPAWLREGMAILAETYPNADYDRALAEAATSNDLIPLKSLCASFPAEAGPAFLAYAESRSFTRYLHDTYGSTGLMDLAASYADGVDCERGSERAFGIPLSNLEMQWRSTVLGQNPLRITLQNISPYLVLLCLVLIIPLMGIVGVLRQKGGSNGSETYIRK